MIKRNIQRNGQMYTKNVESTIYQLRFYSQLIHNHMSNCDVDLRFFVKRC